MPFSAFAFSPMMLIDLDFEVLKLLMGALLGLMIYGAFSLSRTLKDQDMVQGLSQLGYLQRVANCNLYANGFVEYAAKDPTSVWETYGDIWKEKPHLFNEATSDVMRQLEKDAA